MSGDKKHDVDHPKIRLQRYFGAFCDINDDLERYNFRGALSWLETFQKPVAAQVHSQMDLLEKALAPIAFVWDPDLDPATLDPLARRLSEVGDFLRRVAKTLDANQQTAAQQKRFRVALSFPGERREFIEPVATRLAESLGRDKVLYDKFHEAELARPDLDTYLQRLYLEESELIAVFLCADYERKEWCGLEWRAIRNLIKRRQASTVMPLRFDDTEIPGLFTIDGYVTIGERAPDDIANLILERLRINTNGAAANGTPTA